MRNNIKYGITNLSLLSSWIFCFMKPQVLFATCYEPNIMNDLRGLEGQYVEVTRSPSGEISFVQTAAPSANGKGVAAPKKVGASYQVFL